MGIVRSATLARTEAAGELDSLFGTPIFTDREEHLLTWLCSTLSVPGQAESLTPAEWAIFASRARMDER